MKELKELKELKNVESSRQRALSSVSAHTGFQQVIDEEMRKFDIRAVDDYRRIALELAAQVEQKPQGHVFYVIRRVVGTTTMHYEYLTLDINEWHPDIRFARLFRSKEESEQEDLWRPGDSTKVIPVTITEGE